MTSLWTDSKSKFIWGVITALVLTGCATTLVEWGPKYATPGVTLTIEEVSRVTVGKNEVFYKLRASGFPKGKTFKLWYRWMDGRTESQPMIWRADDSGNLIEEKYSLALEAMPLLISQYAKGEPLEVALISTDGTVKAFAEAIPFPIEAKDNRCRLMVRLGPTGLAFAIIGEGFEPGEEVTTESRSNGEVLKAKHPASNKGVIAHIVMPGVVGKKSGKASFTATGKSCSPTVEYDWGPPALKKQ